MNEQQHITVKFDAADLDEMLATVKAYSDDTKAAIAKQQKINEVLFGLIIASPIEPSQRENALRMYERALKE